MKIINHKNLRYWLDKLKSEPQLACGGPQRTWSEWFDKPCTLEFPLGEIAQSDLHVIALVGRGPTDPVPLTGKEGFNAQGLEGKLQIVKPLINALFNLRDILPEHRGRIVLSI